MRQSPQGTVVGVLLVLLVGIILIAANSRGEINDIALTFGLMNIFGLIVYGSGGGRA